MTGQHDVADYCGLFESHIDAGWSAFLITFMFEPMNGGDESIQRQQARLVAEAYARFATRVVRRPASLAARGRLPIWVVSPDFPVHKHQRTATWANFINNGQHVQGLGLLAPGGRSVTCMADHFEEHQSLYVRSRALSRVHAVRVRDDDVGRVWDYTSKMITRRRVDRDAVIVLPRALSEVRDLSKAVGRNSSNFG